MKVPRIHRTLVLVVALAALASPLAASAQHFSVTIGLPAVLPPLVVVEPGVRVVPDSGKEVFFVDDWYWLRRSGAWYRAHDHRARFAYVEPRWVPPALVRIPPGHYRHWRPEHHARWAPPHWDHGWHDGWRHGWQHEDRGWRREHAYHRDAQRRDAWRHGGWREARWERGDRHGDRHGHGRGDR